KRGGIIDDRSGGPEVAGLFRGCRHGVLRSDSIAQRKLFPTRVKKGLIFNNCTRNVDSKLILGKLRLWQPDRVVKEGVRVQHLVAKIFVGSAMKPIRARLRNEIDHAA